MKKEMVFLRGILILLLAFGFAGGSAFSQIETPKYNYGSYSVDISDELFTDEMLRSAEQRLLEYIEMYPDNASRDKARLLLIGIDIKSENYNVAVGLLDEFLANRPNSPFAPQAALKQAFIHFQIGEYREAEYAFNKANILATEHRQSRKDTIYEAMACQAKYWEGITIIHQGRTKDAIASLKACVEQCPSDRYADDAIFARAMLHEIDGEYETAISLYSGLIKDYPESNVYLISRVHEVNCLLILKKPAAAIQVLENADTKLKELQYAEAKELPYIKQDYPENMSERISYLRAEAANTAGNYAKALNELESFMDTYSTSPMLNPVRLSTGYTLLNLKRYDEALSYYNQVIDVAEDGSEPKARALLFRAVTLKRIGKPEEARQELMRLSAQPTFQYSGAALLELGQLYYEQEDYAEARRTLERARREADTPLEDERIQLLLASTYTQLGLWEQAAQEYALAKKKAQDANLLEMPDKEMYIAEACLGRGIALVNSRRGTEAVPELMQFLTSDFSKGKEDKAVFWLAEGYYSGGMIRNAVENYRKLVDGYPGSERREEALYALGWCYFKQKQFTHSSRIFDQMTREFPDSRFSVEVWTRSGDAYYVQKNFARSENAYRKASRLDPKSEEGMYAAYMLCDALYRQGKNEEAITELYNFRDRYANSKYAANAMYLIAWINFQTREYTQAIDIFNFMIISYPKSPLVPRAHYAIGDCYYNSGQYEPAITAYKIITEQYPADPLVPGAMRGIQYCLSALGRDDEAVVMYDDYVEGNIASPFIEDFAYKKGELFYQQGSYIDAVSEYEAFVKKYPDSEKGAEALYYMGKSYDRMNEWDKAVDVFNGIVINFPQTEYAALALLENGLVKIKQTNVEEADSIFVILQEMYPENTAAAQGGFERALLILETGDTTKALGQYVQVAERFPTNEYGVQSRFQLAKYFNDRAMRDSARYHLGFLINLEEDPISAAEAQFRIGKLFMEEKNYEEAVKHYTALSDKFPGLDNWYSYGLLGLGQAYKELNMIDKAIETFKILIEWRPDDDFGKTAADKLERLEQYKETILPDNE
jgi:TolA-binding protein